MKKLKLKLIIILFILLNSTCSFSKYSKLQKAMDPNLVRSQQEDQQTNDALQKYGCKIIKQEGYLNIKKSIYIRIPQQLSEEQLSEIAKQIRSKNTQYQRLFILYLLPDMTIGSAAWATTHYNPTLEIIIMGVDRVTEEKLKKEKLENGEQIGKWYDNTPYVESTIFIYKENGKYKMKRSLNNGSSHIKELSKSKAGSKLKFTYPNDFGEYFLIENNGDLGIYDSEGLVTIAKKIN